MNVGMTDDLGAFTREEVVDGDGLMHRWCPGSTEPRRNHVHCLNYVNRGFVMM